MPPDLIHRSQPRGPGRWEGLGWRGRSIVGAVGLRPPLSDITAGETELMLRHAAGAERIVEIGVFEGAAAAGLGALLPPTGELVLIDPYPAGRFLGVNMSRVVARRVVRKTVEAKVRWLRMESGEAAKGWTDPIDFLRIDGIHTLEGVQRDWNDFSPSVVPGGHAMVRDDVISAARGAEDELAAGDEIVPWIQSTSPGWELVDRLDTTAILRRSA